MDGGQVDVCRRSIEFQCGARNVHAKLSEHRRQARRPGGGAGMISARNGDVKVFAEYSAIGARRDYGRAVRFALAQDFNQQSEMLVVRLASVASVARMQRSEIRELLVRRHHGPIPTSATAACYPALRFRSMRATHRARGVRIVLHGRRLARPLCIDTRVLARTGPKLSGGQAGQCASRCGSGRSACDLWVRYLPRSAFCAEMPGKHPALRILSRSCNRSSRPDTTRLDFAILLHRG